MPWFDLIVFGMLLLSAAVGWTRGATREMVAVLSFALAALAAVYGLKFTGPALRDVINPDWLGSVAAILGVFLVLYIGLRIVGSRFASRIQEHGVLGVLDRSIGVGFGLIRALVVLGAFNLLLHAVTPPERTPRWLLDTTTYPLTEVAGRTLRSVAPQGLDLAGRLQPALSNAVRDGSVNATGDSARAQGYDARQRGGLDDLVEKSR
jgi:membrane protein required for colicin V production